MSGQVQLWYGNGTSTPSESYGALGVMSFGLNGQPSSLGTAPKVVSRDDGAYVKYLGTGETTDCTLEINHKANCADWVFLDAGETGNLNWAGNWLSDDGTFSTTKSYQHGLVIKGDGAGINTMSGKIQHHPSGSQSSVYRSTINVKKQGTGTWRINENAGNAGTAAWGMRGVWEVENGTLQFDSIAEKGVQSALGSSDELFNDTFAVTQKVENAVDYAFVLGGGVGKTRGNLEYVGSASSTAAGRAFVVDGTGAFLNNGSSALELSNFKVKSGSGDSTLVLGGANTEAGLVDQIADGDSGKLSVVKEDAGTWQLGNNLSFTGPLVVKAGKLEVGEAFKCWTFYRMVVKDTFDYSADTGSSTRNRVAGHKMIGLFDAAGNDRVYGLTDTGCLQASPPNNCNYASKIYSYVDDILNLEAGHFLVTCYDGKRMGLSIPTPAPEGENAMTALFSHPAAGRSAQIQSRSPQSAPDYFTESTWHVITMRPVAGEPIVSWDYVNEYCNRTYQTISNCTLEASLDGKTWTQLAEKSQTAIPTAGTWASDGTTKYAADFGTHTGLPIEPGPAGQKSLACAGTSVSVAAGAELKFNSQVSVPKIVVEPTGMGTVTGLKLAENGVIDISPAPAGNVDIAVDFTGVMLPANYSFTVNGAASTAEITLSDDKRTLSVRRRGLQIIVR